jgi:hypothetical protein
MSSPIEVILLGLSGDLLGLSSLSPDELPDLLLLLLPVPLTHSYISSIIILYFYGNNNCLVSS